MKLRFSTASNTVIEDDCKLPPKGGRKDESSMATLTVAQFLGTVEADELFICQKHEGKFSAKLNGKSVRAFGSTGVEKHLRWCSSLREDYGIEPLKKATKKSKTSRTVRTSTKSKPTRIEDSAIRGPASKRSTIRRDSQQVERPVGEQSTTVRSRQRVRITSGYVDPATVPPEQLVSKTGKELAGKALKLRLGKLAKQGLVTVEPFGSPSKKSSKKTPEETSKKSESLSETADRVMNPAPEIEKRLDEVEEFQSFAKPILLGLQGFLEAQQSASEDAGESEELAKG